VIAHATTTIVAVSVRPVPHVVAVSDDNRVLVPRRVQLVWGVFECRMTVLTLAFFGFMIYFIFFFDDGGGGGGARNAGGMDARSGWKNHTA
jgi:hypothetical protein